MYLQRQARRNRGWLRVQFRLVRTLEWPPLANGAVWKSLRCRGTFDPLECSSCTYCNGDEEQCLRVRRMLQGPGRTAESIRMVP
jgi:hypothetical protein